MKRTMKKMVSMALTGTMAVAVLAGAGTSEVKAADTGKDWCAGCRRKWRGSTGLPFLL